MSFWKKRCPCCDETYTLLTFHHKTIVRTCNSDNSCKCLYCKSCNREIAPCIKKSIHYGIVACTLMASILFAGILKKYVDFGVDYFLLIIVSFTMLSFAVYILKYFFITLKCNNKSIVVYTKEQDIKFASRSIELENIQGLFDEKEQKIINKTIGSVVYLQLFFFVLIIVTLINFFYLKIG